MRAPEREVVGVRDEGGVWLKREVRERRRVVWMWAKGR